VTPPGYVRSETARGTWLVRNDVAGAVPALGLAALLSGAPGKAATPGRGRSDVVHLDFAGVMGVGKRARHGGLLGPILGGLYWGTGRGRRPIELARRLRGAGVPTPDVLAAGWRRIAGPLNAIALVTEAVPGACNLQEALLGDPPVTRMRALLHAAADTVRALHEAGFVHADLNLANLVLEDSAAGLLAHVVDLDRGRFVSPLTDRDRARNLSRLLRSHEKWVAGRSPLRARDAIAFVARYARGDRVMARDLLGRLRRYRSRLWWRRLFWNRRPWGGGARRLARPAQQR